jgi:signal recognition particle receptor subunit beta
MEKMSLIVTGTVGAGKSTFIRSVSEIDVVDTDTRATDETALLKQKTTVAIDFGRVHFGPDMALYLYGTPGQSYILLVPAHRPREFRQARQIISFMNERVNIPMIIGITHNDCPGAWAEEDVYLALGYMDQNHRPPIVKVNPTDRDSVVEAVIVLVQHLMESCTV